jgi:hypothetical protein
MSSTDIVVQFPDEVITIRRASARDLDWLAISSVNSAIAIAGSRGVATGRESEIGNQVGGNITSLRGRGSRGRWRRGGCGRRSGSRIKVLNRLLLGHKSGRDSRAALSRSIEVLESDEGSVHASELVSLGSAKRE